MLTEAFFSSSPSSPANLNGSQKSKGSGAEKFEAVKRKYSRKRLCTCAYRLRKEGRWVILISRVRIEVAHLPEGEEVEGVDGPVHVVTDPVVEAVKVLLKDHICFHFFLIFFVFLRDHMIGVEVEDVVEKMSELLLLKPRQELFPTDFFHL